MREIEPMGFQKAATGHPAFSGARRAIERCAIRDIATKLIVSTEISEAVKVKILNKPRDARRG